MRDPIAALFFLLFLSFAAYAQVPDSPGKADFDHGVRLVGEERFDEALEAFKAAERKNPKEAAIPANIGQTYLRLGRPADAVAPLKRAVTLAPDLPPLRVELCRALSLTRDYDAAIRECEKAVELEPEWDLAHSALFVARQQAGRPAAELLRTIDIALSLHRSNEMLLILAADQYFLAGDYLYAEELLQRLISIDPEQPAYHGRIAEVYLRSGRDAQALAAARKALSLAPDSSFGNYAMGLIFYELGQHHEAVEAFSKVRTTEQRLIWANYYRAIALSRLGRKKQALPILQELALEYPNEFDFSFELGSLLVGQTRYEDAIQAFARSVELRPESMVANAQLGLALMESARYDEAIRYLRKARSLDPNNEIVANFLRAAESRQQSVTLIDDMKRYADSNPTDLEVRVSLVARLAFARRTDEIDVYVKQIYALNPQDPAIFHRIGGGYATVGNHIEARRAYEHSISIEDNPAARLGLAGHFISIGEPELAFASFERVLELKPDAPDTMFLYGIYLADYGRRREALEMLKRSIAIKPANGGALYRAGILSEKLGEHEAALQYLDMLRPIDPRLAGILDRCIKLRILR